VTVDEGSTVSAAVSTLALASVGRNGIAKHGQQQQKENGVTTHFLKR
jgi:hypothetical protein